MSARPPFNPLPCTSSHDALELMGEGFVPVLSCITNFPPEFFQVAMMQLIEHPEHNSTLILRSEIVSDSTESLENVPQITHYTPRRTLRRLLVPRRPGRDGPIHQDCTLYSSSVEEEEPDLVILTPVIEGDTLPYYHPRVKHIAFRCLPNSLRLEVIPLTSAESPTDSNSRLYRTSLALLDAAHRYWWGFSNDYKKRVQHDCVVPRETYQDLYLVMRERWKGMVDEWKESTDPRKHVFELIKNEKDIAIAAYLMLVWKEMFRREGMVEGGLEPWKTWGRPPAGFLDLGCGNGLLTHILISEGYAGIGLDVRARASWSSYSNSTQEALFVCAIDPTKTEEAVLPEHFTPAGPVPPIPANHSIPAGSPFSLPIFRPNQFIISNHADELTPWTPILATLHDSSGFLNIPCCPWMFDRRFNRSKAGEFLPSSPSPALTEHSEAGSELEAITVETFASTLNLGGGEEGWKSGYAQYRIWLAGLSDACGWVVETDVLRIPSTRGWAVVGRKRKQTSEGTESGVEKAQEIIREVKQRGVFKVRVPEGKAGDH
ncbi:DUF1613-domain-containing protein [Flagelloscypha sp. PMI_526]|nr:DUF1613-domain-containing protein [Flagelloscypha sp. PMI_526]